MFGLGCHMRCKHDQMTAFMVLSLKELFLKTDISQGGICVFRLVHICMLLGGIQRPLKNILLAVYLLNVYYTNLFQPTKPVIS